MCSEQCVAASHTSVSHACACRHPHWPPPTRNSKAGAAAWRRSVPDWRGPTSLAAPALGSECGAPLASTTHLSRSASGLREQAGLSGASVGTRDGRQEGRPGPSPLVQFPTFGVQMPATPPCQPTWIEHLVWKLYQSVAYCIKVYEHTCRQAGGKHRHSRARLDTDAAAAGHMAAASEQAAVSLPRGAYPHPSHHMDQRSHCTHPVCMRHTGRDADKQGQGKGQGCSAQIPCERPPGIAEGST
jgi:hypothetical protein